VPRVLGMPPARSRGKRGSGGDQPAPWPRGGRAGGPSGGGAVPPPPFSDKWAPWAQAKISCGGKGLICNFGVILDGSLGKVVGPTPRGGLWTGGGGGITRLA